MMKVNDEGNRLSRCGCLCNVVRPDFAMKDVALLRLRMRPLGGHVITGLPGFLPDEASVPETTLPTLPLLPLLPDVNVGNGG